MSENENAGGVNLSTDNHIYKEWLDEWEAWLNFVSIPRNYNGQPVWKPPIHDYSIWIGEEYEKKREATLKYTGGDAARTTDTMDINTENGLLGDYMHWADDNGGNAVDSQSSKFFRGLWREVYRDFDDVRYEWAGLDAGVSYHANEDGTYVVKRYDQLQESTSKEKAEY